MQYSFKVFQSFLKKYQNLKSCPEQCQFYIDPNLDVVLTESDIIFQNFEFLPIDQVNKTLFLSGNNSNLSFEVDALPFV